MKTSKTSAKQKETSLVKPLVESLSTLGSPELLNEVLASYYSDFFRLVLEEKPPTVWQINEHGMLVISKGQPITDGLSAFMGALPQKSKSGTESIFRPWEEIPEILAGIMRATHRARLRAVEPTLNLPVGFYFLRNKEANLTLCEVGPLPFDTLRLIHGGRNSTQFVGWIACDPNGKFQFSWEDSWHPTPSIGIADTAQQAVDHLITYYRAHSDEVEVNGVASDLGDTNGEPGKKPPKQVRPQLTPGAEFLFRGLRSALLELPSELEVFYSDHRNEMVVFRRTKKNNLRRLGSISAILPAILQNTKYDCTFYVVNDVTGRNSSASSFQEAFYDITKDVVPSMTLNEVNYAKVL